MWCALFEVNMELDSMTLEKVKLVKKKAASFHQKHKEWKHCGDWLRSGVVHYVDPTGKERTYETVERTTRQDFTGIDGVDVITLLPPPVMSSTCVHEGKKICLVAVYRPPVDKFSLEFPAGLVDKEESLLQAAKRELAEETGYKCEIKSVSPTLHPDPWKSNENGAVCVADVIAPQDRTLLKLDDDEFLDPIELPLKNLKEQLELLQREHDFVIDAKLYCFAMGLAMQSECS